MSFLPLFSAGGKAVGSAVLGSAKGFQRSKGGTNQRRGTLRLLLVILTSLLSISIHCWTTWLTPGSELFTSWKPVMLAPPFLRSVRSMSRKPCNDRHTDRWADRQAATDSQIAETDGQTDGRRGQVWVRWAERQTHSRGAAPQRRFTPVVYTSYGAIRNTGRTRDQETSQ